MHSPRIPRRGASPPPPQTPRLRSAPMRFLTPTSTSTSSSASASYQSLPTDPGEKVLVAEEEEEASLLPSTSRHRRRRAKDDGEETTWDIAKAAAIVAAKPLAWIAIAGLILWFGSIIVGFIMEPPETDTGDNATGAEVKSKQSVVMGVIPPSPTGPTETATTANVEISNTGEPPLPDLQNIDTHHAAHEEGEHPLYNYHDFAFDSTPRAVLVPPENPTHWTLHLPRTDTTYPLQPEVYQQLCAASSAASSNLTNTHDGHGGGHSHRSYYTPDPLFISPLPLPGDIIPATTCPKTLTYLLSHLPSGKHPHSSLGASLMGVFLAYGLAQHENRTFFLDDTNWEWGNWTDYFKPPPQPPKGDDGMPCTPPPDWAKLPCPHQADHLMLLPLTHGSETFGHQFLDEFEDAHAMEVMRQVNIFGLARKGYEALFRFIEEDEELAWERKELLFQEAEDEFSGLGWGRNRGGDAYGDGKVEVVRQDGEQHERGVVVVHVRHGDGHPKEFWYHKGYLPGERYVDVARDLMKGEDLMREEEDVPVILISDDPMIPSDPTFSGAWPAQEFIPIPGSENLRQGEVQLDHGNPNQRRNVGHKKGLKFLRPRNFELTEPPHPTVVTEESLPGFPPTEDFSPATYPQEKRREMVRGYLLDVKVAGEMAAKGGGRGGVVCGGYSYTCRLLAVMVGWNWGIVQERWRDVDGWVWQEPEVEESGGENGGEEEMGVGMIGMGKKRRKGSGGAWRGWIW